VAESITITDNRTGESLEIPFENGGISAAQWGKLLPGVWFYDPGFVSTAACESAITYLDGEAGSCGTGAIPSSSWLSNRPIWRWPISC
jgi:citrate synthase